ncbi:CDP-alcohol phosphatidyltransferase family protein [Bengtsoniella intestinalis]|uniref:CDP-alcohol phosphatidyltransferase family protein n=1 Tax=Bengtsoniella intestinalis TaxID=3073143 RepID=UPI00391F2EBD
MPTKVQLLRTLPNICTFCNAICGVMALLIAMSYRSHHGISVACGLIVLGGFFDAIDGRLARRLQVSSQIGKELDSFADVISFVIAPVCMFLSMHSVGNHGHFHIAELLVATFYICCGVYRLARYNAGEYTTYFQGLPTTASGCLMSVYLFISNINPPFWSGQRWYTMVSYGFITALGFAMVSQVKIKRI